MILTAEIFKTMLRKMIDLHGLAQAAKDVGSMGLEGTLEHFEKSAFYNAMCYLFSMHNAERIDEKTKMYFFGMMTMLITVEDAIKEVGSDVIAMEEKRNA